MRAERTWTGIVTVSPSTTNEVGDADTISYATNLANSANMTDCPPQHSPLAATGLGLSDFLVGTARILDSGGEIFSTVALTDPEKAIFGNLQVSAAAQLQLALTPEDIRTITYTRTFAITRKVGGGLTFKINDISLSLNGSGNGRTRAGNVITVKMGGPKPAPPPVARGNFALAPMGAAAPGGAADALQNSVLAQRKKQLDILKALPQNNVVVVNPPPGP